MPEVMAIAAPSQLCNQNSGAWQLTRTYDCRNAAISPLTNSLPLLLCPYGPALWLPSATVHGSKKLVFWGDRRVGRVAAPLQSI